MTDIEIREDDLTGARIHLVTVQEILPAAAPAEWQSATQDHARAYLESVAEGVRKDAEGEVTTRFRSGDVVDEWLEEAHLPCAPLADSILAALRDLPELPLSDKAQLRASQAAHPPFGDYLAAPRARANRLPRT